MKDIFLQVIKKTILLDSNKEEHADAFNLVSLPELENWITTWTFNETIP